MSTNITKEEKKDFEIISFESQQDFENWLEQNHNIVNGIWIQFYKKNSGVKTVVYPDALDIALCYGWIDGQLKKYDEASYIQKFTPRRTKSMWSTRNKDHITRLQNECRMKPSGTMEVERAKADGRWDRAYDSSSNMKIPNDFIQQLSLNKKAFEFFNKLSNTNKYAIGYRLQTAKRPETREKRMKEILSMLENEKKFH
jgi:uncharacterized protein YdeI (YjbR/CyaY-like superfamily)